MDTSLVVIINIMLRRAVVKNFKYTKLDLKQLTLRQVNLFHTTGRKENTLILGGLAVAASGIVLQHVLQFYRNIPKAGDPATEAKTSTDDSSKDTEASTSKAKAEANTTSGSESDPAATGAKTESSGGFFSSLFERGYYEGGFEEKMSKREAALILGVRESATAERIKDAHRRILLLNHPDRGGSALIAAKINEAKDLLLKGKV